MFQRNVCFQLVWTVWLWWADLNRRHENRFFARKKKLSRFENFVLFYELNEVRPKYVFVDNKNKNKNKVEADFASNCTQSSTVITTCV
jgi:hypothetical protein